MSEERTHSRPRQLGWRGGLALASVALVLTVFGVELALRLVPALVPETWRDLPALRERPRVDDLFVYDEELGFKLSPSLDDVVHEPTHKDVRFSISTRSLGFRGVGFRDDGLTPGERPVVVVGDSFTFCWTEMEDCWVELLESTGERDFVNLGAPGLGGAQEALMLERYGLALDPQLVIWSFFANDLHDNVRVGPAVRVDRWTWLERRSALFGALRRRTPGLRQQAQPSAEPAFDDGVVRTTLYPEAAISSWVTGPALATGWQVQRSALTRAQALSVATGAPLVVVLMPFRELVYFDHYSEFAASLGAQDLARPYQLMRELCDELGVPVLDLNEVIARDPGRQVFYELDAHLNAEGNRVVANEIRRFLELHGL